jgi:hypothetical protein
MAPSMHATVKLHKPGIPTRPIINWRNAPGYKLAKYLTKLLHNCLDFPYAYNVRNSAHLMTDLKTIKLNSDTVIRHRKYVLKHTKERSYKYN